MLAEELERLMESLVGGTAGEVSQQCICGPHVCELPRIQQAAGHERGSRLTGFRR
jgi:hypothetical protein